MKIVEESSREIGSIKRTIFARSASEKKYQPTHIVAQTRTSGGCNYGITISREQTREGVKRFVKEMKEAE